MYQCLVYQLNSAASESMFADTQIFANINRLVKLLGYNVRGCSPASFNIKLDREQDDRAAGQFLPKYSYIRTGFTDSRGRPICFSVPDKVSFDDDIRSDVPLYNGVWRMYGRTFVATGEENETFTLEGVQSNSASSSPSYVATSFIDVYVRDKNDGVWRKWNNDPNGVFMNQKNDTEVYNINHISMYGPDDMYYTAYLNERKTYEIKFGNGVIGRKLADGDLIQVFYLDTNGPDGEIDTLDLDFSTLKFRACDAAGSLPDEYYQQIMGSSRGERGDLAEHPDQYSLAASDYHVGRFIPEESVADIRDQAPQWFKTGSRLVTRNDYEYFVKNVVYVRDSIPGLTVQDVKCMNNTEYMSTFYKWLYLNGKNHHGTGRYYFDQTKFWNRNDFKPADPADANNVYVWIKSTSRSTTQDNYEISKAEQFLNERMTPVKSMTAEIQVLKPVLVNFDICANMDPDDVKLRYIQEGDTFDSGYESFVEVTLDNSKILAAESIRQAVYDAIVEYFDVTRCELGQVVQSARILDRIYAINGVKNVRTVFQTDDQMRAVTGLSMASWSPVLAPLSEYDTGYDDLQIGDSARKLEDFQFPVFVGRDTLLGRIKIITKQLTQVQPIN